MVKTQGVARRVWHRATQVCSELLGAAQSVPGKARGAKLFTGKPLGGVIPKGVTIAGGLALAIAATVFGVTEVSALMVPDEEPYALVELTELAPVTTEIAPAAIVIDSDAILELSNLLNQFVPLAQAHNIQFDYELVDALHQQSARVGLSLPVAITVPGATNFHTQFGVTSLFLPDEAAALADQITGALEAWITTLAEAPTVSRVAAPTIVPNAIEPSTIEPGAIEPDAIGATTLAQGRFDTFADGGRFAYAPASRSGVRAGQPVTATAIRELAADFDNWVTSEADAAAASSANFRARMVALSRAHGNGRLPAEALCPIPFSPRFTMRCDVIDSLVELNNAFRAHFGRDVIVRSGYRGNPGTSNHGWGLAIDFGGGLVNFGTAEFNWMNANARQFGWGHAFWAVPGGLNPQPWHWEAMDQVREMTGRWR